MSSNRSAGTRSHQAYGFFGGVGFLWFFLIPSAVIAVIVDVIAVVVISAMKELTIRV